MEISNLQGSARYRGPRGLIIHLPRRSSAITPDLPRDLPSLQIDRPMSKGFPLLPLAMGLLLHLRYFARCSRPESYLSLYDFVYRSFSLSGVSVRTPRRGSRRKPLLSSRSCVYSLVPLVIFFLAGALRLSRPRAIRSSPCQPNGSCSRGIATSNRDRYFTFPLSVSL